MVFNKSFDDIEFEDINQLVTNRIQESVHLDYKADFSRSQTNQTILSKELAKDISSFANKSGGYIIYGVESNAGDSPIAVNGITYDSDMRFKEMVEQKIRTSINPIPAYRIKLIKVGENRGIVLIYIPKSINAPHYVDVSGHKGFYTRGEFESRPMAQDEIQAKYEEKFKLKKDLQTQVSSICEKIKTKYPVPMVLFSINPINNGVELIDIHAEEEPLRAEYIQFAASLVLQEPKVSQDSICFNSVLTENDEVLAIELLQVRKDGTLVYAYTPSSVYSGKELVLSDLRVAKQLQSFFVYVQKTLQKSGFMGQLAISLKLFNIEGFTLMGSQDSFFWKVALENNMDSGVKIVDIDEFPTKMAEIRHELFIELYRFFGYKNADYCFDSQHNLLDRGAKFP